MNLTLRGSLADISFIEILKEASRAELTGMIRVESGQIIKVVYLQGGSVSFASSNDKSDKLTEVLKRAGKLTPEQVDDAQSRLKPNISLGKTLVELGYISAKDLLWGARTQVEGILHQLLFWNSGTFQILQGPLPKEIINLNLQIPRLIFDGIRKSQDRPWVLGQIESPEAIFVLTNDFDQKNSNAKLPVDAFAHLLDGTRNLQEVADQAKLEPFEVCKSVAALQILGMAERVPDEPFQLPLDTEQELPEPEPTAEPEPFDEEPEIVEEPPSPQEPAATALGEVLQLPTVEELEEKEELKAEPEQSPKIDEEQVIAEPTPSRSSVQDVRVPLSGMVEEFEDEELAPQPSKPGSRSWLLITGAVLLVLLSGWYFLQRKKHTELASTPKPPTPPATNTVVDRNPSPAVPTPAPPPPPEPQVSSPLKQLKSGNLAEAALSWKQEFQQHRSRFTIQLVIACEPKTVLDAFEMLQYSSEAALVPLKYQGRSCYRILYGIYPSKDAADRAASELPPVFLTQASPATAVPVAKILK